MKILLCDGPEAPSARGSVYLPLIFTDAPVPEPEPVEKPEETFYRLLLADPRQQHPALVWCDKLAAAARWKAADIADNDYWGHRASNDEMANVTARRFGCKLPPQYDGNWNGIESIGAGSPDAAPIYGALGNSAGHAPHLFGQIDFYRQQRNIGIAMASGGRFGWYWIILIAICE